MKQSSRLKNFCELCRKLCRDQNGYLCHLNSASHQRRVEEFKTNPQQLIDKYSEQMSRKFIQIIKSKYPGQTKHLQLIYNEYEQQARKFIKFSNTRWKGLKQFGEYLASGQIKNIKVTGLPPDCYITYTVNKTVQFIEKNKKEQLQILKEKEKEILQKSLQNRIQRQKAQEQRQAKKFQEEMKRVEEQRQSLIIPDRLEFKFQNWGENGKRNAFISTEQLQRQTLNQQEFQNKINGHKKLGNSQKLLSQIISKQQRLSEHKISKTKIQNDQSKFFQDQQLEWIFPGIIVKIKPHEIDPVFHNKKTKIMQLVQPFVAKVQVGTASLQIDQVFLQTVIPKIGNRVMILQGESKGQKGILKQVDLAGGFGNIEVQSKYLKVPFNYFSKYEGED